MVEIEDTILNLTEAIKIDRLILLSFITIPVIFSSIVDKFENGRRNLREDIDLEINGIRSLIPNIKSVMSFPSCIKYILL